jgi:hypothetical protein
MLVLSYFLLVFVLFLLFLGLYFFFFEALGFEFRAYTLSHSTSHFFVKVFFKIGSHKLFVQAGFEP